MHHTFQHFVRKWIWLTSHLTASGSLITQNYPSSTEWTRRKEQKFHSSFQSLAPASCSCLGQDWALHTHTHRASLPGTPSLHACTGCAPDGAGCHHPSSYSLLECFTSAAKTLLATHWGVSSCGQGCTASTLSPTLCHDPQWTEVWRTQRSRWPKLTQQIVCHIIPCSAIKWRGGSASSVTQMK